MEVNNAFNNVTLAALDGNDTPNYLLEIIQDYFIRIRIRQDNSYGRIRGISGRTNQFGFRKIRSTIEAIEMLLL